MMTSRRLLYAILVMAAAVFTMGEAADPRVLPSDTELALTINVKQILNSPLVKANQDAVNQGKKELENQYGDNPVMQLIKNAGFDLFRDLETFTVTTNGSKDPTAIIIEGKFNSEKFAGAVEDYARENPNTFSITKDGGQTFYEITPPGEKAVYATLIEGKTFMISAAKEALTDAMSRLDGNKNASFKREFVVLLNTTNVRQSFSLVATGAALSKLAENPAIPNGGAVGTALQGIDGVAISMTMVKDINFQLGLNAKDEQAAKKMAKDWNGLVPFAQIIIDNQAQQNDKIAPLSDVIKSIKITSQGNNVLLKGTMSVDVIEALLNSLSQ